MEGYFLLIEIGINRFCSFCNNASILWRESNYTGFNKYTFEYMGNTYRLKTAIVKNKYELPYNIDKL